MKPALPKPVILIACLSFAPSYVQQKKCIGYIKRALLCIHSYLILIMQGCWIRQAHFLIFFCSKLIHCAFHIQTEPSSLMFFVCYLLFNDTQSCISYLKLCSVRKGSASRFWIYRCWPKKICQNRPASCSDQIRWCLFHGVCVNTDKLSVIAFPSNVPISNFGLSAIAETDKIWLMPLIHTYFKARPNWRYGPGAHIAAIWPLMPRVCHLAVTRGASLLHYWMWSQHLFIINTFSLCKHRHSLCLRLTCYPTGER